jgi:hypothetical protein
MRIPDSAGTRIDSLSQTRPTNSQGIAYLSTDTQHAGRKGPEYAAGTSTLA